MTHVGPPPTPNKEHAHDWHDHKNVLSHMTCMHANLATTKDTDLTQFRTPLTRIVTWIDSTDIHWWVGIRFTTGSKLNPGENSRVQWIAPPLAVTELHDWKLKPISQSIKCAKNKPYISRHTILSMPTEVQSTVNTGHSLCGHARHAGTRRMLGMALKQRAEHAKSQFFIKRSKVRKVNHAFLPQGFQIEDLTQTSCHA